MISPFPEPATRRGRVTSGQQGVRWEGAYTFAGREEKPMLPEHIPEVPTPLHSLQTSELRILSNQDQPAASFFGYSTLSESPLFGPRTETSQHFLSLHLLVWSLLRLLA